jgi:hypothetical protein
MRDGELLGRNEKQGEHADRGPDDSPKDRSEDGAAVLVFSAKDISYRAADDRAHEESAQGNRTSGTTRGVWYLRDI